MKIKGAAAISLLRTATLIAVSGSDISTDVASLMLDTAICIALRGRLTERAPLTSISPSFRVSACCLCVSR